MKRSIIGLVCLALVQTAMLQPARTQGTQPTGKPFRVAMIEALTGPTGTIQQAFVEGAQAAAKKINAEGGILGRPVQISVFDNQFDPARSVSILQDDVLTQNFDFIHAGGGSITTNAMLPSITKAKILSMAQLVAPNPTQLTADNPMFFDTQPSATDAGAALAAYLSKIGVKKLGVLYSSEGFGTGTYRAYEPELKKLGIPIVAEAYDVATVDITPTLLKLKAEAPDHLFAIGFGAPAGHILNSLDKLGWDVPLIGDLAFGLSNLPAMAPAHTYAKLMVQAYRVTVYISPPKRSPRFTDFLNRLKADGPITQTILSYSTGWDSIMLVAMAAKKANSTDEQKMVQAMEHLDVPPSQRTYLSYLDYNFTPASHVITTGPNEYAFVPYTLFTDGMVGYK